MKTLVKNQQYTMKKVVPSISSKAFGPKDVVTIPIAASQQLKRKLRYINVAYNVFKPSQSSYFSTLKPKPSWNETLYGVSRPV